MLLEKPGLPGRLIGHAVRDMPCGHHVAGQSAVFRLVLEKNEELHRVNERLRSEITRREKAEEAGTAGSDPEWQPTKVLDAA